MARQSSGGDGGDAGNLRVGTGVSSIKAVRAAKGDLAAAKTKLAEAKILRLGDRLKVVRERGETVKAAKIAQDLGRLREALKANEGKPIPAARSLAEHPRDERGRLLPKASQSAASIQSPRVPVKPESFGQWAGRAVKESVTRQFSPDRLMSQAQGQAQRASAAVRMGTGPGQAALDQSFMKAHADYKSSFGYKPPMNYGLNEINTALDYQKTFGAAPRSGSSVEQMKSAMATNAAHGEFQKVFGTKPPAYMSGAEVRDRIDYRQLYGRNPERGLSPQQLSKNVAFTKATGMEPMKPGMDMRMMTPALILGGIAASGLSRAAGAYRGGAEGNDLLIEGMKGAAAAAAVPATVAGGLAAAGKFAGIGMRQAVGKALLPGTMALNAGIYGYNAYKDGKSGSGIAGAAAWGAFNAVVPYDLIKEGYQSAKQLWGSQPKAAAPQQEQQGRLAPGDARSFAEANDRYSAMKEASAAGDGPDDYEASGGKRGYSDQARNNAYKSRMANRGKDPDHMPHPNAPEPKKEAA